MPRCSLAFISTKQTNVVVVRGGLLTTTPGMRGAPYYYNRDVLFSLEGGLVLSERGAPYYYNRDVLREEPPSLSMLMEGGYFSMLMEGGYFTTPTDTLLLAVREDK